MSQQQPFNILKSFKDFLPAKMSQPQTICILEIFKDFFGCKIVVAANHLYPGNIQRLFRLQICLSRKSSISWIFSKTFSPANLSQPQIIENLEIFKDFFACKIVLGATHHNFEIVQKLFLLQNCLSRKSAISWKHSNIFPPAKLSQQQPIKILKSFKEFLPAKMSQPQTICILELFKDFFACKNVLAANHLYPGNIQRFFGCKNVLVATNQNSQNIQKLFRLQKCVSRKSSIPWRSSKIFRLQKCLSRKSSISWKHSKTFSAAKMSQPQIIDILEIFKDFFGCKFVLAAKLLYPGNNHRLFRLQTCLSRKSSISWNFSKTFSPAKLSQQQPIIIQKMFKNFFACKIVLAANQRYPGNIQSFFRLQNCLSSNPSKF